MKTFMELRKKNIKEEKDKGEYDYEGDMAKSQLRSIVYNANMLHDMLEDDTNLPEWVQSKITLAEDYIVTAAQYMQSQMNEEVAHFDEVTKKIYVGAVKQATDPDSSKGDSDKIIARAKKQHGEKFAKDLKGIEGKSHFVRANHSMGYDTLRDRGSPARVTQSGKANKQDVKAIKNKITSRLGKHKTPNLPEAVTHPDEKEDKILIKKIVKKMLKVKEAYLDEQYELTELKSKTLRSYRFKANIAAPTTRAPGRERAGEILKKRKDASLAKKATKAFSSRDRLDARTKDVHPYGSDD